MPDSNTAPRAPRVPPATTSLAAAFRRIAAEKSNELGIIEDNPLDAVYIFHSTALSLATTLSIAVGEIIDPNDGGSMLNGKHLSNGFEAVRLLIGMGMIAQSAADEERRAA